MTREEADIVATEHLVELAMLLKANGYTLTWIKGSYDAYYSREGHDIGIRLGYEVEIQKRIPYAARKGRKAASNSSPRGPLRRQSFYGLNVQHEASRGYTESDPIPRTR